MNLEHLKDIWMPGKSSKGGDLCNVVHLIPAPVNVFEAFAGDQETGFLVLAFHDFRVGAFADFFDYAEA